MQLDEQYHRPGYSRCIIYRKIAYQGKPHMVFGCGAPPDGLPLLRHASFLPLYKLLVPVRDPRLDQSIMAMR